MRCSSFWFKSVAGFALLFAVAASSARAEDGSAAWLRYAPITRIQQMYKDTSVADCCRRSIHPTDRTAAKELKRGLSVAAGPTRSASRAVTDIRTAKDAEYRC